MWDACNAYAPGLPHARAVINMWCSTCCDPFGNTYMWTDVRYPCDHITMPLCVGPYPAGLFVIQVHCPPCGNAASE
jgi:hypothetical protein